MSSEVYCRCPRCGLITIAESSPCPAGAFNVTYHHGKKVSQEEGLALVMLDKCEELICPDCDKDNHHFILSFSSPFNSGSDFFMPSVLPK